LAHALDSAYHLTQGKTVCFGMADTIMKPEEVFACGLDTAYSGDDVVLILFPTERPEKFGMVRLGKDNHVFEIVDKPRQTDLKFMWGCIIWRPSFTEHLHDCVQRQGYSILLRS
jgi:glucose-1-phosphate thymidylyltransferase